MMVALRAKSDEGAALRWMVALIGGVLCTRLIFAATLGLGIDESYTVATSRQWALGTFDHPPMAWWLAGGAAKLFGSELPFVVRLPFLVLSIVSTWLAFDAGRVLYGPRAGLMAAISFNLAPVLAWTSGSMVLPDGPLLAALLAGLCCLCRAFFGDQQRAPRWWLLAGLATGLACLSKLHGVFLIAGTGLFVLTTAAHRHWLWSPWPYAAAAVALLVFSPVLIWNAEHHWISFAFQAGRARASRLDLAGPVLALGGQALFLLPWVWLALVASLGRAASRGPRRARDWLLFCLAIGPIAVFTLVALTGTKTLFHWAAPGYLFACVLLGRDLAQDAAGGDWRAVAWLRGSAAALAILFVAVLALARLPWPLVMLPGGKAVPYPLIETQSWSEVRGALAARGLLGKPHTFVAALKWHEAARLDVALGGVMPVRCLCDDARGYGVLYDNDREMAGADVVVIGQEITLETMQRLASTVLHAPIVALDPIVITHAGQPLQVLRVFGGKFEPRAVAR